VGGKKKKEGEKKQPALTVIIPVEPRGKKKKNNINSKPDVEEYVTFVTKKREKGNNLHINQRLKEGGGKKKNVKPCAA